MGYQLIDPEGNQIPIGQCMRIGSNPACDIIVKGTEVSPYHVIIGLYPDGLLIRDEDSVSGTYVNGERLDLVSMLKPGDRVRVGQTEFIVQSDDANPIPQTSGVPETKMANLIWATKHPPQPR
jgi:pSer/pThr/pTyr-binding forkhead associated (FHA) protein